MVTGALIKSIPVGKSLGKTVGITAAINAGVDEAFKAARSLGCNVKCSMKEADRTSDFKALDKEGQPITSGKAESHDVEKTQAMICAIKTIDPCAQITFNDSRIMGVSPGDSLFNDTVRVIWSGNISVAVLTSSKTGDPAAFMAAFEKVQQFYKEIAEERLQQEKEEALEEYKGFDFRPMVMYFESGAPAFWNLVKALQEGELAWEKEQRSYNALVEERKFYRVFRRRLTGSDDAVLDAATKKYTDRKNSWGSEKQALIASITQHMFECLKTLDPIALKTATEKYRAWENDYNEAGRKYLKTSGGGGFDIAAEKYIKKHGATESKLVELNCVMEYAKNTEPAAFITALKALEEKMCDPSEAKRRQAQREAKATERRKARYAAQRRQELSKMYQDIMMRTRDGMPYSSWLCANLATHFLDEVEDNRGEPTNGAACVTTLKAYVSEWGENQLIIDLVKAVDPLCTIYFNHGDVWCFGQTIYVRDAYYDSHIRIFWSGKISNAAYLFLKNNDIEPMRKLVHAVEKKRLYDWENRSRRGGSDK